MADPRTELEIRIRTIAEEQGIKLTEQGLQRIKERTQELGQRTGDATGEFKGFTAAQKEQAHELLRGIETKDKAARAAQNLARDVKTAGSAFSGLKNVIGGALTGNIGQMADGFKQLSNAATQASPRMQALFQQIARGAAAASVVVGPVLVAIGAMKMAAADAEAAMKRWWDEAAKGAEAYKQKSAEVKAAAAADLERMIADVQRLAQAYDDLLGRMDNATKRAQAVTAAQKELELAKANTPEERAAVEARFAATAIDNDKLNANLRERNAEEAKLDARAKLRDAEAAVREAESRFKGSPTRANQDAIAAAKANLGKVEEEVAPIFTRANEEIDNARLTREVGGIRKQTLSVTTAKATAASTDNAARRAELRRTAEEAQARGDFAAQGAAVAELKKLNSSAANLTKAIIESGATTTSALDAATKELHKQKQRQKNTAESRAGS